MRWKITGWLGVAAFVVLSRLAAGGQAASGDSVTAISADEPAVAPIRKIALIVRALPAEKDPIVQKIMADSKAAQDQRKRKRSLPRLSSPNGSPPAPKFLSPGAAAKAPERDPAESVTPDQLTALANLYFVESFADRLRTKFKISLASEEELGAALTTLHLKPEQMTDSDAAQRLCAQLKCDAVIVPGACRVEARQGTTRDLVVRVTLRVPALRDPNSAVTSTAKPHGSSAPGAKRVTPPTEFTVAGAATVGHAFLSPDYANTRAGLAQQAARQAAALAVHTLWTGEPAPLMQSGDRVAIAPVLAPTQADALLFTPAGRKMQPAAVQGLVPDVSSDFRPDLLPVFTENVRDADAARNALQRLHAPATALWKADLPNIPQMQALGRALDVPYILAAHVTDVDAATATSRSSDQVRAPSALKQVGPASGRREEDSALPANERPVASTREPSGAPPGWEREAQAEAVGVLVRVRDGAILWQGRGTATMTSRTVVPGSHEAAQATRLISQNAIKFALIDLNRQFLAYRAAFER